MQYTAPRRINTARNITKAAEIKIKKKTGMNVMLVFCPDYNPAKTPEQMLKIIAASLGMDFCSYKLKSRERNLVDLRFIAAYLLRYYFPTITLQQITIYFGGQDHTSIMNGLLRAETLIASGDERFTTKYETVLKAVNKWLRREASGYASAISA